MTAKSILEISVVSAEWERYKAAFDKYNETLKKQPAVWAAISKQHASLTTQMQNTAEAIDDEHKKLTDLDKINEANEKRLDKTRRTWQDVAGSTESFAKNIASTSSFLSKWGGLIFGGALGGTFLGVDRAVHDASSQRQAALGLGVSIGELKAFNTNFERIGDTSGLLQSVNTMETDPTQRIPWYNMMSMGGLGQMSGNTVKDTMAFLDAERRFAQKTPLGMLGMMGRVLQLPSDAEQLRLIRETKNPEWAGMNQGAIADFGRMNVPGAKSLQELETQFGRNWGSIWSAFQTQLTRAAPALEKMSDAAARATAGFINRTGNDIADEWNKIQADPKGAYWDAVKLPFQAFWGLLTDPNGMLQTGIGAGLSGILNQTSRGGVTANAQAYGNYLDRRNSAMGSGRGSLMGGSFWSGGVPDGLLKAIFQAESGGNLYPPNSSKGAMGPFQFTADTAKMLGINPYDPLQAEQGAEKYLTTLFEEFHDLTKVLAGYNWGPGFHKDIGMTLAQLFQQHPNDWQRYVPKETQDYIRKIEISMHLIPGASATVAAQQLAH